MPSPIESTKNPLIRRFRDAARGQTPGVMVAEGRRLATEALGAGVGVVVAAWSPKLLAAPGGEALLDQLTAGNHEVHECSDKVLARLSELTTHQGISLLLRRPDHRFADIVAAGAGAPLIVVAAGVQDPGNLGALVRSAEAAGAAGLIVVSGSADPYRDKSLRGSAGSAFRVPIVTGLTEVECIQELQRAGVAVVAAADVPGAVACWDADLRAATALVLGAEGAGVPAAFQAAAKTSVVVPLAPTVESLNVAVAAGVLLFEARRQRS